MNKYKCPCCKNLTFEDKTPGTFEICPVCYWEDDPLQFKDINYSGGANKVTLKIAKENYKRFGAISKDFIKYTKKLNNNEIYHVK